MTEGNAPQPVETTGPQQYAAEDEVEARLPDPYVGNEGHSAVATRGNEDTVDEKPIKIAVQKIRTG